MLSPVFRRKHRSTEAAVAAAIDDPVKDVRIAVIEIACTDNTSNNRGSFAAIVRERTSVCKHEHINSDLYRYLM